MKNLRFIFAVTILTIGCSKEPDAPPRPAPTVPASAEVNEWLVKVSNTHGFLAHVDGNWAVFDGSPVKRNGYIATDNAKPDMHIVELHMRALLPDNRLVVQQVVGWGKDSSAAIAHAEASFLVGTYHVFLGAFIDPAEEHVKPEKRHLCGRECLLTSGDTLKKTLDNADPGSNAGWQEQLMREIDASSLAPGLHWIDVYHGHVNDEQIIEIQLDGGRWTAMEQKLRDAPWPKSGKFTSVRQFLVIQDVDDVTRPKARPARRVSATTRSG